jgi:cellulose synthase/poly-beta-1,6-N-acetylglucosamine synthase-like glycosyltransferase
MRIRWKFQINQQFSYTPKTCVIIPCKGTHTSFRENIEAFCTQDYHEYSIVFVTDSSQDAAYPILEEVVARHHHTKVVASAPMSGCSGKISALLSGMKESDDVEVYVFADSDIKPHKEWLRYLISPLDKPNVGATTGYRWYFPHDKKSLLVSTWNLAGMAPFFFDRFNYTWGGSTAIRKELFEKLEIGTSWKSGFSDDLILTNVVKQSGYKIQFVPKCVVESIDEGESIRHFLRWGTREYTWARWYNPLPWIIAIVRSTSVKILFFLGIALLLMGFIIPGALMISTIVLEMICGGLAFRTVRKMMWYPLQNSRLTFSYALMMPIAFTIIAYNAITSSYRNSVVWGGRTYSKSEIRAQR